MSRRSTAAVSWSSVVLAVGAAVTLSLCGILVLLGPVPTPERLMPVWPLVVAAGFVWLTPSSRRSGPVRSARSRRWYAVLHGVAAVLVVAAWVLATGFLYVIATLEVWKSGKESFGPLVLLLGVLGLVGSLDRLHRTLVSGVERGITLLAGGATATGSAAALAAAVALLSGPGGDPMSPVVAVLAGTLAFGGPLVLAIAGVIFVHRSRRRRNEDPDGASSPPQPAGPDGEHATPAASSAT